MSPAMQFKFDPNQDFQLEAVAAVADLFDGQRRSEIEFRFELGAAPAIANRLDLDDATLLRNLQMVQKRSFDPKNEDADYLGDDALQYLDGAFTRPDGTTQQVRFPNFSVEMETGTGKTYVYLRTALELFRRYAFRKFIIVVPSVAIREGVLKTLQMTQEHFRQLFDNAPYRFYAYDSASLSQVRNFALGESVEFMVMTLAAFNKADINVIHQSTDRLQGETPIHLVQATRPILILDEPQNMESERSIASLAALNPLFALRYSATHRVPYNVVYRLTPAAAYRRGLVKRIEVAAAEEVGHTNRPYIKLISTKAVKHTLTAKLVIHVLHKSGQIRPAEITVGPGRSLYILSGGLSVYQGYDVDEINDGQGWVGFANTDKVYLDKAIGDQKHALFEAQIRYTIEEHIKKQLTLIGQGIKVLSLFFIDRVDNYADPDNGVIRQAFDRQFEAARARFPDWRAYAHPAIKDAVVDWSTLAPEDVRAAYFAQRKTKTGEVILEDSKTGTSARDREAYELIMQQKERLLAFDQPVSFIFSHSALREGWDNPNVFQICTLNQSVSDVKKRQEIGRGMRLAVDHSGERNMDEQVNVLTVVANESYDEYVRQLQAEIGEEYRAEIEQRFGKSYEELTPAERRKVMREYGDILPPKPANARQRKTVVLNKRVVLKEEFKELWARISQKTRYSVHIDTDKLIADVVASLQGVHIQPPRVVITKAKVDLNMADVFEAWQMSAAKTLVSLAGRYPLPNLVDLMMQLMEHTSPPMRLTRRTLLEIIKRAPYPQEMIDNPVDWASAAVAKIKEHLSDQLIRGIQYHKIDEWYAMELFDAEVETWEQYVEPAENAAYDGVIFDSEVEHKFIQDLEHRKDVRFYVKLPNWFKVPTPIGNYNPDWAIVMDDPDAPDGATPQPVLYLVAETKGHVDPSKLRFTAEGQKVFCGCKHFREALGIPYDVVTNAGQLPGQHTLADPESQQCR